MADSLSWNLYRSFLAVLREGSLSAAARSLGATQPTVGRHIATLEKSLAQTLFVRTQTGLLPTDMARALEGQAAEMASIAASLERVATSHGGDIGGVVRVTASEIVGVEMLPAIVAPLRGAYPKLQLELVLTNRPQDLLNREADIAIRMFRPEQAQLIARRVGRVEVGLHATPGYLARNGTPVDASDLEHHSLIGFDVPTEFLRQAMRAAPPGFERQRFAFATDYDLAQLALIRAGAGIGGCQVALARREPQLVRVLPDAFSLPMEIWITMHEDLRRNPPCRAVFDALVDGLAAYTDDTARVS
jgi:DNA-binding transcriptional LysR family regulator